jgi:ribonuclease HII
MEIFIGIDEAGRGPVIGAMFIAAVAINKQQSEFLKASGVKDSKLLSQSARERLSKAIMENCLSYKIKKVTPQEIDARTEAKININKLEAIKIAQLINELKDLIMKHMAKIYVDCPSNNIPKWKNLLLSYVDDTVKRKIESGDVKIIVEHHAERHISVAAASILAKQAREDEIEKIKDVLGLGDFGSGYPSDPVTIGFLKRYREKIEMLDKKHRFLRWSWITSKILKPKHEKQKKLKDFFQ